MPAPSFSSSRRQHASKTALALRSISAPSRRTSPASWGGTWRASGAGPALCGGASTASAAAGAATAEALRAWCNAQPPRARCTSAAASATPPAAAVQFAAARASRKRARGAPIAAAAAWCPAAVGAANAGRCEVEERGHSVLTWHAWTLDCCKDAGAVCAATSDLLLRRVHHVYARSPGGCHRRIYVQTKKNRRLHNAFLRAAAAAAAALAAVAACVRRRRAWLARSSTASSRITAVCVR